MATLIGWIVRAVVFGTIVMYGAMGEILTEKAGHLNLGTPGIMCIGGAFGLYLSYRNTSGKSECRWSDIDNFWCRCGKILRNLCDPGRRSDNKSFVRQQSIYCKSSGAS